MTLPLVCCSPSPLPLLSGAVGTFTDPCLRRKVLRSLNSWPRYSWARCPCYRWRLSLSASAHAHYSMTVHARKRRAGLAAVSITGLGVCSSTTTTSRCCPGAISAGSWTTALRSSSTSTLHSIVFITRTSLYCDRAEVVVSYSIIHLRRRHPHPPHTRNSPRRNPRRWYWRC